jgi:hypothetical protein
MKTRLVISVLPLSVLIAGCATTTPAPRVPGACCAVLEVHAKPKAGVKEHFARVPVYDAAPQLSKPKGQFEHVDYTSLGNIVVWLEPVAPAAKRSAAPTKSLRLPIDAAHPSSEVRPASVGQEIVFRNAGSSPLSLYSVSDNNDFDLPAIPPGGEARYAMRGEGLIEILSDPSQPPVALVYAAPSPWVAAARAGQTVTFDDVAPPGDYRAVAWHPRLPGKTTDVTLLPGKVRSVTLDVGVNNIASAAEVASQP